ncbi:peptidylprolyl isomerase [Diaphorobacter ruginosibacter]|uniref:peptidylprolyl isomerase n=1 Tax=Diaphorobacter ruginosibacter TaxID=1715720 RepID=UPI003340B124
MESAVAVARVNGVALHGATELLGPEELRQRACTELLRQQAQLKGLLDGADQPEAQGGGISDAAAHAIEQLLDRELDCPEPSEDACRRYYAAHPQRPNEQALLRHILFAVTQGVDVAALRQRAESVLLTLRAEGTDEPSRFSEMARELSNCPSGAEGGALGWLGRDDCAEEFSREIFSSSEVGVMSHLVHSRFGLHVVEVLERKAGEALSYENARAGVVHVLRQQAWTNAVRRYLQSLAEQSSIEGVAMDSEEAPLAS